MSAAQRARSEEMVQVRENLITAIIDSYLNRGVLQQADPEKLPVRYIMPGKLVDLYIMYQAAALAARDPVASRQTFRTAWKSGWYKCLRFRKVTTHSMCSTCHRLRALVRHASSIQDHAAAASLYMQHIKDQWLDRQVYWRCRAQSRQDGADSVTIIADGMDRSKFALPRWYMGAAPKGISDKARRPQLEVSAVLVHGHGLYLFITDEDTSIGASWVGEIVMQSLDCLWKRCQRLGRPFPQHLIIQADNTVREAKNGIFQMLLCLLTMINVIMTVTVQHLRVGHTHEDVDAVFALISTYLREADEDLQCPQDVVTLLYNKLGPHFRNRGEEFEVKYIQSIRAWKDIMPDEVSLKGAYGTRHDMEAPHSFTFIKRCSPTLSFLAHCLL